MKKYFYHRHFPFFLLAFSVMVGLVVPVLIQDGMFMDALLYTSVSHNLSLGYGTFWFPEFSLHNVAGMESFHEQPPLVFGLQSLFFNVFGDSLYVERFYTLVTLFITAWLIIRLWKITFPDNPTIRSMGYIPLILWITVPVCIWSYSNAMHENTLGIFTLGAVLFSVRAFTEEKRRFFRLGLSGFMIFLATLSKGVPGLFPLAVPFLYWLFTHKITLRQMILFTLCVLFIPVMFYAALIAWPVSRESLYFYFVKRALFRMGELPTVESRFYIVGRLVMELLPALLLTLTVIVVSRVKKVNWLTGEHKQLMLFYIFIGISASVPLMLTMVQKGFYLIPAFPFFAVAFSIVISSYFEKPVEKINVNGTPFRIFSIFTVTTLLASIVISGLQVGKTSRDTVMLHDIRLIGKTVPPGSVLSISEKDWNQWNLQCYFMRYYQISLTSSSQRGYYIYNTENKEIPPAGFEKLGLPTRQYHLYKRPE